MTQIYSAHLPPAFTVALTELIRRDCHQIADPKALAETWTLELQDPTYRDQRGDDDCIRVETWPASWDVRGDDLDGKMTIRISAPLSTFKAWRPGEGLIELDVETTDALLQSIDGTRALIERRVLHDVEPEPPEPLPEAPPDLEAPPTPFDPLLFELVSPEVPEGALETTEGRLMQLAMLSMTPDDPILF